MSNPNPTSKLSVTLPDGSEYVMYEPFEKQQLFHASNVPKLLAYGSRGSGKSMLLRMDAHMRALSAPNCSLILVRETMPQLTASHLIFIEDEMRLLGGRYHGTKNIAYYPNGSRLFFSHVGGEADSLNQLSAEYLGAYFDELSTIPWEYFMKIVASVRVKKNSGLMAVVRAATNPLGPSADMIRQYFVEHDVDPNEDPDYMPLDWDFIKIDMQDNPHLDRGQYLRQFAGMPAHVKKAWLDGEWALENALFNFQPVKDGKPYHVIHELPTFNGKPIVGLY